MDDKATLAALISLVENLTLRVHELGDKLDNHLASIALDRQKVIKDVLEETLPGGDASAHKKWHESEIKEKEARADFWAMLRNELAKYGLIGFIGWAGYYLWIAFLHGPPK